MNKYSSGYCFTALDCFKTFNATKLKFRRDVCQDKYGCKQKDRFCARLLLSIIKLIILDIIENNVTFVLPLFNNRRASIHAKAYYGDSFKKACQNGAFQDVDFLGSNFTGCQLIYSWDTTSKSIREKTIHISAPFRKALTDNVNRGKLYY